MTAAGSWGNEDSSGAEGAFCPRSMSEGFVAEHELKPWPPLHASRECKETNGSWCGGPAGCRRNGIVCAENSSRLRIGSEGRLGKTRRSKHDPRLGNRALQMRCGGKKLVASVGTCVQRYLRDSCWGKDGLFLSLGTVDGGVMRIQTWWHHACPACQASGDP